MNTVTLSLSGHETDCHIILKVILGVMCESDKTFQKGLLLLIIQTINSIYPLASSLHNAVSKCSVFSQFSNTFFYFSIFKIPVQSEFQV